MKKIISISLLLLFGMMLFPWKLICIAHPAGHANVRHETGKLSPCELHRKYAGKETCFLPPMHCHKLSADTDDYQPPVKFQVKLSSQSIAILVVAFELIKFDYPEQSFILPPEPRCRSGTIVSVHALRGPPVC